MAPKASQRPQRPPLDPLGKLPPIVKEALLTQRFFWPIAAALLLADAILTLAIIRFISYTEIDFSTYMQQASLFLKGVRDYRLITGDTGPCVYPAGHLYFYSALHWLTKGGKDLRTAQYVFAGIYLMGQGAMMAIYRRAGAPPLLLPLLLLSKRLHSIYVLRLFNDGICMTFMWLAILAMSYNKFSLGAVLTSLALSIKMNILLFLPALAVISFRAQGFAPALLDALTIVVVQILLGLPFLLQEPGAYLSQAFDLSRQFLYRWTVNLRFLSEEVFLDRRVGAALLLLHGTLLVSFGLYRWTDMGERGIVQWLKSNWNKKEDLTTRFIILTLFTSNLIGILCARSLHYQFYSWYAPTLPFLVWSAELQLSSQAILLVAIEYAWNVFPSTQESSVLLMGCHLLLLIGLWRKSDEQGKPEGSGSKAKSVVNRETK